MLVNFDTIMGAPIIIQPQVGVLGLVATRKVPAVSKFPKATL